MYIFVYVCIPVYIYGYTRIHKFKCQYTSTHELEYIQKIYFFSFLNYISIYVSMYM